MSNHKSAGQDATDRNKYESSIGTAFFWIALLVPLFGAGAGAVMRNVNGPAAEESAGPPAHGRNALTPRPAPKP